MYSISDYSTASGQCKFIFDYPYTMPIQFLLCWVGVQDHKGYCALKLHIKSVGKSISQNISSTIYSYFTQSVY